MKKQSCTEASVEHNRDKWKKLNILLQRTDLYIAIDDLLLAIENGHEIQSKHENVQ
jgi:hypothetical protein